jgi:hypothetical protein
MTTVTKTTLVGHPAVVITQEGCYPATFVSYGRLPFGERQADVRLVHGVAFTGYWDMARSSLEEMTE